MSTAQTNSKISESVIRGKLHNVGLANDSLNMATKVQTTKANIDVGLHQNKISAHQKKESAE